MGLGNIGGYLLISSAAQYQISADCQLGESLAHFGPAVGEVLSSLPQDLDDLDGIAQLKPGLENLRLQLLLLLRVRAVRIHRKLASRLGEFDEIGRHGHIHFVTAALQLTCNRSRRFDVSSCPVYCDGELYGPAPVFAISSYGNRFGAGAVGFIPEFKQDLENTKSWMSIAAFNAN